MNCFNISNILFSGTHDTAMVAMCLIQKEISNGGARQSSIIGNLTQDVEDHFPLLPVGL